MTRGLPVPSLRPPGTTVQLSVTMNSMMLMPARERNHAASALGVWLISLHVASLRFIPVVAGARVSFLFKAELCSPVWIAHILSAHPQMDIWVVSIFRLSFCIVGYSAEPTGVQVSPWDPAFSSYGYITRLRAQMVISIFNFLTTPAALRSGYTTFQSHLQCPRLQILHLLTRQRGHFLDPSFTENKDSNLNHFILLSYAKQLQTTKMVLQKVTIAYNKL